MLALVPSLSRLIPPLIALIFIFTPISALSGQDQKDSIDKWVKEFTPSTLTADERREELLWFQNAAKSLQGLEIRSVSEIIESHGWEKDVLAKAFEEITGIKVVHDNIREDDVILKITEQMMTGRSLYHIYVNDADMVGTHLRLNRVVNLTEYMKNEGKPFTNPSLDLDDFLNLEVGQDYDGNQLQLPDQQFPSLYWFRHDWFTDPATRKEFLDQYGYELGVPLNWAAYEDIAEFFTGREDTETAGGMLEKIARIVRRIV